MLIGGLCLEALMKYEVLVCVLIFTLVLSCRSILRKVDALPLLLLVPRPLYSVLHVVLYLPSYMISRETLIVFAT